ncbi:MAG: adenosylmethionine decarboxylase [Desulfurococcales archaeon]|nr:adenosylmethionine decarboxylase [Desulfurococcales archaeon]
MQIESRQKSGAEHSKRVYATHVFGNLIGCSNTRALKEREVLEKIVEDAVRIGNMTLLDIKSWKIGEGLSVVAIILESHIAIHTWPEFNYATVDVYSCGAHTNPEEAFNYIVEMLKPRKIEAKIMDRSLE